MIERVDFTPVIQFKMGRVWGEKPIYITACYYVDGLLIDTGPFHVGDEVEKAFKGLKIHTLVNTHHHEDHIGNNLVFQQKWGIKEALAHPEAVERIKRPEIWIGRLKNYQHIAWGVPPASEARPIGETVKTPRHEFKVIYTPGHSDDHICLLEEEQGWLFSGDIFIREEVKTLRSDENFHQLLASLYELAEYNFTTIFCGSGLVVNDAREALKRKIEYFENLKEQVWALYKAGWRVEEITDKILGKESALFVPTEGDFAKINLVKSILNINNL